MKHIRDKPHTLLPNRPGKELKKPELSKSDDNRYKSLFVNASEGIFFMTTKGNFIEVNESFAQTHGYTVAEMLNLNLKDLDTPETMKLASDRIRRILNGETLTFEVEHYHKDGHIFPLEVTANLFSDGKTSFIQAYNTDITERKLAQEEIQLRSEILDNMEEGVLLIRASDAVIVYMNPKAESIFGFDAGELLGKPITSIYSSTEELPEEIIKKLNINKAWQGETQMIKKNGTLCWGHVNVSTFVHPRFGPVWISIYTDITELKKAEKLMAVNEEKYRTTLNASPDGILLIDMKGIIHEVSEIGLQILGADTRDDLEGKDFSQLFLPEEQNTINEIIEKTITEGLAQNIELKTKKKNQSIFLSEVSSTLIQGPDGSPVSFMVTIRDISYRKKMESKQIHADRMANIGEMASGVAHEINQPLNIIAMVMDKLLFEADKTETVDIGFLKNKSDKIFENITRIRNIIDNISAFSRKDDDYISTVFDINSSITDGSSLLAEQFKQLGITLKLELDKTISRTIGNTYKFEQVIVNLLTNAKDAILEKRDGSNNLCEMIVTIKSYQENQFLIVEVTDNGIGISNDDIHNIMLPFYTTKEAGKGTGLGLSICYQIIKELNGTIDITSEPGVGTKIKLTLNLENKNGNGN
ncbi:MAG: PAS domain S-box protein [Mariniphaga sp.]